MFDRKRIKELLAKAPKFRDLPLPEGLTDPEIDSFQERIGIRIPHDFREFLKLCNGAWVDPGIFGIRKSDPFLDIETELNFFPSWKGKGWIPIASDGCGNHYVVATRGEFGPGEPVFFSDHENSRDFPRFIVASDVGHFLVFFLEAELGEERWSFDKEYVTRKDSDILKFQEDLLPWEVDRRRANEIQG